MNQELPTPTTPQPINVPPSPLITHEPVRQPAHAAVLHFVTPKIIAIMVAAWLIVIAGVSAAIARNKAHSSQTQAPAKVALVAPLAPDDERKADVDVLNERLAEYYATFGVYPSISQINSQMFRPADPSFKKADRKVYADPQGLTNEFATQPTKNQYHYIPTPVGCNSSSVMCTSYTVGATLATGELYELRTGQ